MNIPDSIARHLDQGRAERALLFDRSAINEDTRTAALAFASEEPYERYWGVEILDTTAASMRQGRLRSGANLLCDHDTRDVVGVVESVEIGADRVARAVVRFGKSARAEEVWQDVRDGIRRNVSVGYLIHKAQLVETVDGVETYRVTDWEPFEVSLVSVPADATVGIGRSTEATPKPPRATLTLKKPNLPKETIMENTTETRDHAKEIAAIAKATTGAGVPELAMKAIQEGQTVEQFQQHLIRQISTKPISDSSIGMGQQDTRDLGEARMLRTAADFRRHYSNLPAYSGERLGLADFLRGVARMKTTAAATRALSVGVDTAGGFAVPSVVMPDILAALAPASSLLTAGAAIVPLNGDAKSYSFAAVNTLPVASWRAENGPVAESDPAFRNVLVTPRSLAFVVRVSRELLADGVNIESALRAAIAQAFAVEIDRAGLRGSGTAPEIRGLLNTVGVQAVGNGANGTSLGSYANLFSATQAILQANGPMPTAAIMSPRSLVRLGALADSTGQPLQVPGMLSTMQMLHTSQIPNNLTVGTSNDCSEIYVGNFSQYAIAMREELSVQMLQETYAASGQIGFMCHARLDVAPLYPAAFAIVTGVR